MDCKTKIEVTAPTKQTAIDIARANGWAVSRGRTGFYCPKCAPSRRNVGKNGGKRKMIQQRINLV